MMAPSIPRDCPECRSAGSVPLDICDVCDADFGERGAVALPPTALPSFLRLTDVLAELAGISTSLESSTHAEVLRAALDRTGRLLRALHAQFKEEVLAAPRPKGAGPARPAPFPPLA